MDQFESAGGPGRRAVLSAVGGAGVLAVLRPTPAGASVKTPSPAPAKAPQKLVRGGVRQYARPRIEPGHRLVLPAGATILAGGTVRTATAWPYAFLGGRRVDLGEMAPAGSPSTSVILTGLGDRGWYEIRDQQGGLVARREWNAGLLPYLRLAQEWGATTAHPYWGAFYAVRLEPVSLAV